MGHADVINARIDRLSEGQYRFNVTVKSQDSGWDSFADAFEVLAPDGTVLGKRELLHPHETEQPFTRSLNSVQIPASIKTVTIRAHHKEFGYSGETLDVNLPA